MLKEDAYLSLWRSAPEQMARLDVLWIRAGRLLDGSGRRLCRRMILDGLATAGAVDQAGYRRVAAILHRRAEHVSEQVSEERPARRGGGTPRGSTWARRRACSSSR